MVNSMEILEWDSSFFGYPVAKVTAEAITAEQLAEIKLQAEYNGIRLLYLFADPVDAVSVEAAAICNAKLVDQKITFHININSTVSSLPENKIEHYEKSHPSPQLVSLAMQSGLYSRYKVDPGFKNREFEKLYLAWIENSVSRKIADYIFVYKELGFEIGFVTLKIRDNSGQIGLIAVDESSRGKSIGRKLISAVINKLLEKNVPDLEVATQLANSEACNFYEKAGFAGIKTENIYHIWF